MSEKPQPLNFACPGCGSPTAVVTTRTRDQARRVVRRRRCQNRHCKIEFTTAEVSTAKLAELYALAGLGPVH